MARRPAVMKPSKLTKSLTTWSSKISLALGAFVSTVVKLNAMDVRFLIRKSNLRRYLNRSSKILSTLFIAENTSNAAKKWSCRLSGIKISTKVCSRFWPLQLSLKLMKLLGSLKALTFSWQTACANLSKLRRSTRTTSGTAASVKTMYRPQKHSKFSECLVSWLSVSKGLKQVVRSTEAWEWAGKSLTRLSTSLWRVLTCPHSCFQRLRRKQLLWCTTASPFQTTLEARDSATTQPMRWIHLQKTGTTLMMPAFHKQATAYTKL